MLTNRDVIEFYQTRKAHLEDGDVYAADEYVSEFQRADEAYVEAAGNPQGYDYLEACAVSPDAYEPNQKWHLLQAYYGYLLHRMSKQERQAYLDKPASYWRGAKCVELMLWMAEAAGVKVREIRIPEGKEITCSGLPLFHTVREYAGLARKLGESEAVNAVIGPAGGKSVTRAIQYEACRLIRHTIPWQAVEGAIKSAKG